MQDLLWRVAPESGPKRQWPSRSAVTATVGDVGTPREAGGAAPEVKKALIGIVGLGIAAASKGVADIVSARKIA